MFEEHASQKSPHESCALVYNNTTHIVNNAAADKVAAFLIPRKNMLEAYRSPTGLQRIIHSHTMTSEEPSEQDIKNMLSTNCPWSIYSTLTKSWYHSDEESK